MNKNLDVLMDELKALSDSLLETDNPLSATLVTRTIAVLQNQQTSIALQEQFSAELVAIAKAQRKRAEKAELELKDLKRELSHRH